MFVQSVSWGFLDNFFKSRPILIVFGYVVHDRKDKKMGWPKMGRSVYACRTEVKTK